MSRIQLARLSAPIAVTAFLFSPACNSSETTNSGNEAPGEVVARPDGGFFIADPNRRGEGPELGLTEMYWGRLVDVFGVDEDGEPVLAQRSFLINGNFNGGNGTTVETNPVNGSQSLMIDRVITDDSPGGGRDQFFDILRGLDQNLERVPDTGLGGAGLFTMIPRNATIALQFDDLLDPNSVDATTVRIETGVTAFEPFEARVFTDPNHGGSADRNGDGTLEFYPTRVYLDPTVSELEAFEGGLALPVNNTGLPESQDSAVSNLAVRVPTATFPAGGQVLLLRNLTNNTVSPTGNGTVDFDSPTVDVTRVARSGGRQEVTGDAFNGFLADMDPPRVIGGFGSRIVDLPEQIGGPDSVEFLLPTVRFDSQFCSKALRPGAILEQQQVVAEVVAPTLAPSGGTLNGVSVILRAFPATFSSPADWLATAVGPATIYSPYDPVTDAGKEACFVDIDPVPDGGPELPGTGVAPDATYTLRFSEPMLRASFSAFDAVQLTRTATPSRASDWTVGELSASIGLREFQFLPTLPLAHVFGQSETYYLSVSTDGLPPTDLAGNIVTAEIPPIPIQLRSGDATSRNGSRVLRFTGIDEEEPIGDEGAGEQPMPEFFGQHNYDLARQTIRPRPVTRFEAVADRTQPAQQAMTMFNLGVQEPLSPLGSKLQMLWRNVDFNFSLDDPARYNVDVEGLNWAPQGLPSTDRFDAFEVRLAHGRFLPDEYNCTGVLSFPGSGIGRRFRENLLSPSEDPQMVIHHRSRGYAVEPGDLFSSANGTPMMPFPVNRGVAPADVQTYTWRDTALRTRGGEGTSGAPTFTEFRARGIAFEGCTPDVDAVDLVYPPPANSGDPVNIRSVALPLLVEFRCFPSDSASGLNIFDVSFSQTLSFSPPFRAHSSGGVGPNGVERRVDPDLESLAQGGFNPFTAPGGQPTPPNDNFSYMGSLDLVVRVSRSHSVWFLANESFDSTMPFNNPKYATPVVEPRPDQQAAGTRIELAFRGAAAVGLVETQSARSLDAYGDQYDSIFHSVDSQNPNITFVGSDEWRSPRVGSNPLGIDGAQYYQVRLSFFADIFSGNVPELSSLGMAWHE